MILYRSKTLVWVKTAGGRWARETFGVKRYINIRGNIAVFRQLEKQAQRRAAAGRSWQKSHGVIQY